MQDADALTPEQRALADEIDALHARILRLTLELLASADFEQQGQWAVAVNAAVRAGVAMEDIAATSGASLGTVRRWASGQSAPARIMAAHVRILLAGLVGDLPRFAPGGTRA